MPLYEYQCDACGHRFERIQRFSDPPVDVCPLCNGAVSKLVSSPAIQFKGSGWYITDYARKAAGSEGGPPAPESKTGGDTTPSKSTTESGGANGSAGTKSTEGKSSGTGGSGSSSSGSGSSSSGRTG